jgi:hypothetical protein
MLALEAKTMKTKVLFRDQQPVLQWLIRGNFSYNAIYVAISATMQFMWRKV